MTTQVRPLSGGAWNTVVETSDHITLGDPTTGLTLQPGAEGNLLRALNSWINCVGSGPHAARAQKIAGAVGLQIQEV